ncbi:uncharacterized protein K452DRAFT_318905 [Aplosporella prunicola CBS 121167]|uniref:Tetraspanin Tsp3 n=1 Tax=Aplosporella prunicola CBS 121167 TaxID=1176127 RepID=A0A6A6BCD0_9PEZI|nr:uncharacterized protein K452DRAFT_318905 [Aplosporella prunicola CBS 121167]KAF2141248.1 hypothetical protein K452DRAFT_318905 [Aplosporella prunicola CBS 121167]
MAYTKRQIVTTLSVLYLLALTAVACYAHNSVQRHSLPISSALSALTIALPALTGLITERLTQRASSPSGSDALPVLRHTRARTHGSPNMTTLTLLALTAFTTALATLAGTHLGPENDLTCALNTRWQALYRANQGRVIRRIQDDFTCCGLHSVYDMAWPFPTHDGHGHTSRSRCAQSFERDRACFGAWRGQERHTAGAMLAVTVLVYLWELAIIFAPSARRPSWLASVFGSGKRRSNAADDGDEAASARRAIDYDYRGVEAGTAYSDNPRAVTEVLDAAGEEGELDAHPVGDVQRAVEDRLEGGHSRHTLVPSGLGGRDEGVWMRGE